MPSSPRRRGPSVVRRKPLDPRLRGDPASYREGRRVPAFEGTTAFSSCISVTRHRMTPRREILAGVMSGTSLDGVDAVLADFAGFTPGAGACTVLAATHVTFPSDLRRELLALQDAGADEIVRAARAANALADLYVHALRSVCLAAGDRAARRRRGRRARADGPAPSAGRLDAADQQSGTRGRARVHDGGRGLPDARHRGRRAGRAARAGVPRGAVQAAGARARRREHRRHRERHDPAHARRSARLRHGAGQRPARPREPAVPGRTLRRRRRVGRDGRRRRGAARLPAGRAVFRVASAEEHRARPLQRRLARRPPARRRLARARRRTCRRR